MNFPLIRHKDFKAWIPSTDIDEIDSPEGVLTEALNVDFRNGYIENSQNAVVVAHPTLIQNDITAGYELLSMRGFTHSDKGDATVYVLYKYSSAHLVKIWLVGGGETVPKLMNIDERSSDITWLEKPQEINYNLVNNQLKINLNCLVRYNDITDNKEVIANLTLCYIEHKSYIDDSSINRDAGWYLFPRWLGWSYDTISIYSSTANGVLIEDFEADPLVSWIQVMDLSTEWTYDNALTYNPNPDGITSRYIKSKNDDPNNAWRHIRINGAKYLSKIKFNVKNTLPIPNGAGTFTIKLMGTSFTELIVKENLTVNTRYAIEFDISDKNIGKYSYLEIWLQIPDDPNFYTYLSVDNIELIPAETFIIVAKYDDGQRGLLASDIPQPIFGTSYLRITKKEIDFRVSTYEIYNKISESLYYLYAELDINSNWTFANAEVLQRLIVQYDSEENGVVTLPFRYGLPADTRVDNQRHIYMEIEHKGRIFFIKDDYKVYQSHISANMAIQADAFPYDEEVGFGYFITAHNRINRGIAITPTNYLAIFTDSGFYVYFIQPSSTGSFKTLRLSSGSIGLSSRNSITRSLTGDPATDGLFWVDDNGIYFYTGDSQPPKNLILPTHEKYWREEVSPVAKTNTVGFYNPLKREYWLKIGSDAVGEIVSNDYTIVYELPYDNWKRQRFTNLGLDEFYGVFNNVLYYRSGNQFVKMDMSTKSIFVIETPYNTGHIEGQQGYNRMIPEIYDKILQEVYMVFENENNDSTAIYIETIVDGKSMGTLTFNPKLPFEKWLTPLGIRFNRIKFKVSNSEAGHITRIKEFGCSYTLDTKEPLGQQMVDDQPSDNYGYGRSYGRAYGRN